MRASSRGWRSEAGGGRRELENVVGEPAVFSSRARARTSKSYGLSPRRATGAPFRTEESYRVGKFNLEVIRWFSPWNLALIPKALGRASKQLFGQKSVFGKLTVLRSAHGPPVLLT